MEAKNEKAEHDHCVVTLNVKHSLEKLNENVGGRK
jgi:hypothetical protein